MSISTISPLNAELIDATYQQWRTNPASVDPEWAAFFEGFELGRVQQQRRRAERPTLAAPAEIAETHDSPAPPVSRLASAPSPTPAPVAPPRAPAPATVGSDEAAEFQRKVDLLIYAYRDLGHTEARLDPLTPEPPANPLLQLSEFHLDPADLDRPASSRYFLRGETVPLREIVARLRKIYCGTVGAEYMHIQNPRVRRWLRERVEQRPADSEVPRATQTRILRILMEAETFERFLHTKYVGQKRFSLEGAESLMVILDELLERSPETGVAEIVMGMAHRGRLNVLANFLHKSLRSMFSEFSENYVPQLVGGDGDVKYHLGYQSKRRTSGGHEVAVHLAANPSHLEAVDPVVQGKARARQRLRDDTTERKKVLPLLVHGDAAFAGQGIVAEVLNMSQLPGYRTGGTVHVIVNNQIGFTTLPADARSTFYATDVAKMIEAPIFHVNGDDPLAVAFVAGIALDFRQQFGRDVFIDMYCYRRHGHNEGDEPVFTQPDLYAEIGQHPPTSQLFKARLVQSGLLSAEEADALDDEYARKLEETLVEVRALEKDRAEQPASAADDFRESTAVFQPPYSHEPAPTAISRQSLEKIVRALTAVPENFRILPKVKRILLDRRAQVFREGGPYDWAYAESIAFGSLLAEGIPVRLSGQDSRRGTFSQRHAVLYDAETRDRHIPLMHVAPNQARFCVYNSLLSEAAVLGFDYGYSLDYPSMLCLWEAQFGDFANGAQVIIDQFIASSESKWQRPSSIVMLLPHGYEGQGPEHSSARLERFLQLCAEDNIQVCNPTTPAQYFHLLRRQLHRPFRKPLVVMTPKSLLRSERCVSREEEFTSGHFREILPGPPPADPAAVKRLICCSGKVYYDLLQEQERRGARDVALLRVEQLYPFHDALFADLVRPFTGLERCIWCQEEPMNMGAWSHIGITLSGLLDREVHYAGRPASPSPAVGSLARHKQQQQALVAEAFEG